MSQKLKPVLIYLLGIVVLNACSVYNDTTTLDTIFSTHYEHKMISSGDNFPDFYTRKDSLDLFLVSLHEKIALKSFQRKADWSAAELNEHIQFLTSKNWLKNDKQFSPTVFIASHIQGEGLFDYGLPIALKIEDAIENELRIIKKMFAKTDLSHTYSFDTWAFFILSDVLLDNWQINNIEREFLQAKERPERHQKNYYFGIMENIHYPKEQFGIYGNQYRSLNDTLTLNIYGNNRNIVAQKIKNNPSFLDSIIHNAPKISKTDNRVFSEMAQHFKPFLIKILDDNRHYINTIYKVSGYSNEISFEEFFIWWYHFIYTEVTNMLAYKHILTIPKDGNFYSLIVN